MKKTFSQTLKADFNTTALVMIPICIGINIVAQLFMSILKLPFFFNAIGTFIAAIVAGPWVGFAVGILTNTVAAFTVEGPVSLAFAIVNGAYGLLIGWFGNMGWFRDWVKGSAAGFLTKVITIPLTAPISVLMFGGVGGNAAENAITAFLLATGMNIWESTISQGMITDGFEKIMTAIIAMLVIRALPKRILYRFSRAPWAVLGEKPGEELSPMPAPAKL
jgi:energy-coupling factor transport system substrate-specific component